MEILIYSIISWVCIFFAISIYIVLWRKHNLHGWTQFAFLVSALFYFLLVFIRKLHKNNAAPILNPSQLIERLYTFFTLAHCTNIVNLSAHIFWTFLKGEPEISIKSIRDLRPLFKTLIICWTFPALITLIELFVSDGTIAILERAVLVALIAFNFVIIVGIVVVIVKLMKESQKIQSATPNLEVKSMTFLFLRLFCITGFIWTIKGIPIMLLKNDGDRIGIFWNAIDMLSDTYGAVIFIAFIFNKRIISALKEKFPILISCWDHFCPRATSREKLRFQSGMSPRTYLLRSS